jgi:hypothetical protein
MRNLFVLIFLTCAFFILACEKDKEEASKLNHVETLYGGCNNNLEKSSVLEGENDTVIVLIENDTLNIRVGVNYMCCAIFEGKSENTGDTLQITVSDICTADDTCYCKCMCYYTFDFRYAGFEAGDYRFKVKLWDALEKKYIVLFKGVITIKNA